jgi:hypothetical protein
MRLRISEAMGARQAMGMPVSLAELAEYMFPKAPILSSKNCVRRLINGTAKQISIDALARCCEKLDVSADFLLGIEEQ